MQPDELPAEGSPPGADAHEPSAPQDPDREDAAKPPRRPRRRRRHRDAPAADESSTSEPEAAAFLEPPPVDGEEVPARDEAPGQPGRGRARRRRARRPRSGRGAAKAQPRSAEHEAPGGAAEPSGSAPPLDGDEGSATEEAPERGRRRRRARKRRKPERAAAVEAEPDVAVPPVAEGSGARAPDKEPAGERESQKRRRAQREGRKRGGRRGEGRRGEGRRGEGRRGEGRRSEGRRRDPRAIDIVPRAPDPSEAAKEKVLLVNAADREEARIALLVDGVLEEVYVETPSSERSSAGNIYRGRVQNVEPGIGAAFVDLGRGQTGFLHVSDLPLKEDEDPDAAVTERLHAGDEVIVQITRDSIGRKGPALTGRISFPGRYLVLMPFTGRSGISRRIPQGSERERVRKLLRKLEVPDGMGVIVRTASETTDAAALRADLDHLLKEWEYIKRKAAEPGQPGLLRDESDLAERSVRDIMPGDVTRIVVDKEEMAGKIHRLLRIWYPSAAAAAEEAAHAAVRTATAALERPRGELTSAGPVGSPPASPLEDEQAEGAGPPPEDEDAPAGGPAATGASGEPQGAAPGEPQPAPGAPAEEPAPEAVGPPAGAPQASADEGEPEETEAQRLERLARMAQAMPEVELHTDAVPLFHRFGVETQLEDAFRRGIRLPSGGSIVIDPTEALVAVDVNSGRLTGETDPEATALVTNLEAVSETARQLRLRDLGGLVVIDFIDMRDRRSRRQVELALREALSHDRARIRMGRMGPFGLVILSRQRIRQALSRLTHEACPTCAGTGRRRLVSGLGMRVLREMQARAARSRGRGGLEVRAPQEVVSWIQKHRGSVLRQLRKTCSGPITLEADARLASDGWAMKGLPPTAAGEGDAEEDPPAGA